MTLQKYPTCADEVFEFQTHWHSLENNKCDMIFNVIQCGYDGGDCEDFNSMYPDCKVEDASRIANGICDGFPYNSHECRLDGGDCRPDAIYCDSSKPGSLGDGVCDENLNTHECFYDKGDCIDTKFSCQTFYQHRKTSRHNKSNFERMQSHNLNCYCAINVSFVTIHPILTESLRNPTTIATTRDCFQYLYHCWQNR